MEHQTSDQGKYLSGTVKRSMRNKNKDKMKIAKTTFLQNTKTDKSGGA